MLRRCAATMRADRRRSAASYITGVTRTGLSSLKLVDCFPDCEGRLGHLPSRWDAHERTQRCNHHEDGCAKCQNQAGVAALNAADPGGHADRGMCGCRRYTMSPRQSMGPAPG